MILILSTLLLRLPCLWAADPITPSGLNTQVSTPITVGGQTQYNITGGTRPESGTSLFHSFGEFGVPTNNIANFLNETALHTDNILARITGGDISTIFGTIRTTGFGNANLFLMNPNGFLFGPNATVNVGGMATFTTAEYMRLTDGGRFNANPNTTAADLLTAAPVAAFGFIGSAHAIDFEGGQLKVAEGTGITLVGGDINLAPDHSGRSSGISAPGRQIQLTSVAGEGKVVANTAVPEPGMALGNITLGQGTILSTVGNPSVDNGSGGVVSIRGGQLVATGAQILTGPAVGSMGQGGTVTIATTDSASFTNSTIDASSFFSGGNAGAITVTGSQVRLQDTRLLAKAESDGTGTNSGGNVNLAGTASVNLTRSIIATDTFFSNGNGGTVTLMAPIVSMEEGSFIKTDILGDGITPITASGGAVTLAGTTSISLERSGISTKSFETEGNSGAVKITAPIVMIVGGPDTRSVVTSTSSFSVNPNAGNGGEIEIKGTNVTLTEGAFLQSVADSPGTFSRGGAIRITATENILAANGTSILTTTTSHANAGNIDMVSKHVTIMGQSALGSETLGPGGGGSVKITGAENIALESGSTISTNSASAVENQGPAGHIEFNTQQLTVTGGSKVTSSTFHNGAGGTITIEDTNSPAQSVLIDGSGSGLFTDSQGTGKGGSISVNTNTVTLQNGGTLSAKTSGTEATATGGSITVNTTDRVTMTGGASITASSAGPGDAGNIFINAGQQFEMRDSSVTTQAMKASGGNIDIRAVDRVRLINSEISSSVQGGASTAGGNITIDPNVIVLQDSDVTAKAIQGAGGNITLTAPLFLADSTSLVDASSQFGVNGRVTIQSPTSNLSGSLGLLTSKPSQAQALLTQRCAVLVNNGQASSFVVAGREQLPSDPGGWLTSSLAFAALGESLGTGHAASSVPAIMPIAAGDTGTVSLRRLTPTGFLMANFADSEATGCRS